MKHQTSVFWLILDKILGIKQANKTSHSAAPGNIIDVDGGGYTFMKAVEKKVTYH